MVWNYFQIVTTDSFDNIDHYVIYIPNFKRSGDSKGYPRETEGFSIVKGIELKDSMQFDQRPMQFKVLHRFPKAAELPVGCLKVVPFSCFRYMKLGRDFTT